MTSETAVDDDIIESVASDYSLESTELSELLTSTSLEEASPTQQDAVEDCYELQQYRNEIGEKLESAATSDTYYLVDNAGAVFWVDEYDGFGAYIHMDEGDTHYVSLQRLRDAFAFERAN